MYLPVFLLALIPVGALVAALIVAGVLIGRRLLRRNMFGRAASYSTPDRIRVVSMMPHGRARVLIDVALDQPTFITLTVNHLAMWRTDPGVYTGLISGTEWGDEPASVRIPRSLTEIPNARAAFTDAFETVAENGNLHLDIDLDTWEPGLLSRETRGLRPKSRSVR